MLVRGGLTIYGGRGRLVRSFADWDERAPVRSFPPGSYWYKVASTGWSPGSRNWLTQKAQVTINVKGIE
jgi:hypothetical protein